MKQLKILVIIVVGVSLLFISHAAHAKVTGSCSNCHTMHNSQDGSAMAVEGAVAWTGGAGSWELSGDPAATAGAALTVSDCVGCHSSQESSVIVELGGCKIPIVYNTGGLPDNAITLAGGNFCFVETKGDAYGHNVYGISDEDSLSQAPGNQEKCGNQGCHFSLAREGSLSGSMFDNKNGCEGCHYEVSHHDSGTSNTATSAYRFLEGHGTNRYVIGKEDDDWEETVSPFDHNEYKGLPGDYVYDGDGTASLQTGNNMSAYCKGCHQNFHWQTNVAGTSWLRHPSDAVLPSSGEYAAYTIYNPEAPVARPDPETADPSIVAHGDGGDMVMCLSCHRPHGSPYADILRWDYSTMNAGTSGASAGTGCFVCHTNKDGS